MRSGKSSYLHSLFLLIFAGLMIAAPSVATGATETPVYSFTGGLDGSDPASQLVFDGSGSAYGTTVTGGTSNCGTVFKLTPAGGGQWQQSVLLSFDCFNGGKNPYGGVTLDTLGNLYGTTVAGGSGGVCSGDGCGVVYRQRDRAKMFALLFASLRRQRQLLSRFDEMRRVYRDALPVLSSKQKWETVLLPTASQHG